MRPEELSPLEECLDLLDDSRGDDAALCVCILMRLHPRTVDFETYVDMPGTNEPMQLTDARLGDWVARRFTGMTGKPMPADAYSAAAWAVARTARPELRPDLQTAPRKRAKA